jgi:hypothetical protein
MSRYEIEERFHEWLGSNDDKRFLLQSTLLRQDLPWLMEALNEAINCLDAVIDGFDANEDEERCGLSEDEWNLRIKKAIDFLNKTV